MAKILLPEIVRKEIDDSHYYWVNGEYYPGVTTILEEAAPVASQLKQYFIQNSAEEIRRKSDESLELGSRVHDAAQELSMGEEINLQKFTLPSGESYRRSSREKKMIMSFHNWFHDVRPTHYVAEHVIANVLMKYAGTLDFAGWLDSKKAEDALTSDRKFEYSKDQEFWIVDYKTSAGIYFNYKLQLMAYKRAYEEMYKQHVDHVAIVRLGTRHKRGYEFEEVREDDVNFEDFKKVYEIYLKLHGGKIPEPPTVDVFPDTLKIVETDLVPEPETK